MRHKIKQFLLSPLFASFYIPFFIMLAYFAYRQMAPFGDSSVLTVDLGQQYIDFFAWFKYTLSHDWSGFFYAFSNGLGGDMISGWAYYLLSPFNLLYVFIPVTALPSAILWVTVIKIGLAGWTMAFALQRLNYQRGWSLPIFAVNYALMGWLIANALNLLWLDSVILFPLVVLALEKLILGHRWWPYPILLAFAIISNYYIGYMIALFLVIYVGWRLLDNDTAQRRWHIIRRFSWTSLLAGGLSSWILLPTVYQLRLGKVQYQSDWHWGFDNSVLDLLTKLIPGSFDFDQMQDGTANIFVSAFVLLGIWAFLEHRQLSRRVKVGALLVTFLLILATTWAPLTLIWHGFQYPVWYPYRFSFLISFWLIWLTARTWQPSWRPQIRSWLFMAPILVSIIAWSFWREPDVSYLTWQQIAIFTGFMILQIVAVTFANNDHAYRLMLLVMTSANLSANVILSLNHFSYLTNSEVQRTTRALTASTSAIASDDNWYRVGQTFQRTRGDAMMANFNGGSHFSSALPKASTHLFSDFGQPEGDNYINYANGTKVTDALFNMKYFFTPNGQNAGEPGDPNTHMISYRADLADYRLKETTDQTYVWENPNALSLGFAASAQSRHTAINPNSPIANQNSLLAQLTHQDDQSQSAFTAQNFTKVSGTNLQTIPNVITNAHIKKRNPAQVAELTLTFEANNQGSYYLALGGSIDTKDDVEFFLNQQKITQFDSFRHTVLLNLTAAQVTGPQTLTIRLHADEATLGGLILYQLNESYLQSALNTLKQHPWHITDARQNQLSGSITTTQQQSLIVTSIPNAPGWQATVDGQVVQTTTVAEHFLAIPTKPGQHHLTLTYIPPLWWHGVCLTFISLLVLIMTILWQKRRNRL